MNKLSMQYTYHMDSPLGRLTMVSEGTKLCGLFMNHQKYYESVPAAAIREVKLPVFERTENWLRLYFSGVEPDFLPDLYLEGTAFQKEVWQELLKIPYGKTTTYGAIASVLAQRRGIARMSARAVGGAVGRNPVSIIVPCHRVIGADGSLTGYGGGIDRKIALLKLEKAQGVAFPERSAKSR